MLTEFIGPFYDNLFKLLVLGCSTEILYVSLWVTLYFILLLVFCVLADSLCLSTVHGKNVKNISLQILNFNPSKLTDKHFLIWCNVTFSLLFVLFIAVITLKINITVVENGGSGGSRWIRQTCLLTSFGLPPLFFRRWNPLSLDFIT